MNTATQAPAGLSWASFQALSAESGQWLWGTAQGAFHEKASFSQIMTDAIIGMVPMLGDVTAVRDLIAVTIGLVDAPKKRESTWEWVLLIILLFALIPVMGGVIKGTGRIVVKISKEAELPTAIARQKHLQEGAQEIVAFLNRIGSKNAEKWLLALRISDYQASLLKHFNQLIETMSGVLVGIHRTAKKYMPTSMAERIKGLVAGLAKLKEKGAEMVPNAVKEFDQRLREIQAYVRSGGETTSRMALHEVAVGERAVTRADEARLLENGPLPARSSRGGFKQNTANIEQPKEFEKFYQHKEGYPDLKQWPNKETGEIKDIIAFSGKIINRPLKKGEKIFRVFGPEGITHQEIVATTSPKGAWWGLGPAPSSAKEWREKAAVLDEFNRGGFMVTATIPADHIFKAAVGTVAEQKGKNIPGQYLPGGATQALIDFPANIKTELTSLGEKALESKKAINWRDPLTGMEFTVQPIGWDSFNGIHGYIHMPGIGKVQTARLSSREMASK